MAKKMSLKLSEVTPVVRATLEEDSCNSSIAFMSFPFDLTSEKAPLLHEVIFLNDLIFALDQFTENDLLIGIDLDRPCDLDLGSRSLKK